MQSEYLTQFDRVRDLPGVRFGGDPASPDLDYLLIEKIDDEEVTTKSGLVIAKAPSTHRMSDTDSLRAHLGFIVWAGDNVRGDKRFAPGTVILLNEFSIRWYSTFPGLPAYTEKKLGLTLSSEIKMSFENIDAFNRFQEALASGQS
jgi:hypothetical protein